MKNHIFSAGIIGDPPAEHQPPNFKALYFCGCVIRVFFFFSEHGKRKCDPLSEGEGYTSNKEKETKTTSPKSTFRALLLKSSTLRATMDMHC